MSEGSSICSRPGGWLHVAGWPVGYAAVEGGVKACSVLLMLIYMHWTRWRVSHGHLTAAKNLVFPIYGYILYLVAIVDLTEALLLEAFSRDSAAPPLVVAFCWAASRLATEGLVIFLIHSGIGLASIRRSAGVASLWAIFSFMACYIVQTERFQERSHVVALVYLIPPWVFYLASIVIPLAWFPRRPAVLPISILMLAVFTTEIARETLMHHNHFADNGCWAWSVWSLLLWAVWPWVIYKALVMDSLYWQGLYSAPQTGNLNTPLLGVWGALTETPASTLASCISDLEAGDMVPIIPFAQLHLRTDVKFSSGSNSRVYQGEYKGEVVAVKMLFSIELDPGSIRSFCEEARVLHSLRHPHILACRGVCILPPAICLITEYCDRGSLYEFLKLYSDAPAALNWPVRVELMLGCAAGVEHLHSRGLVHCDIKSLNFLVQADMTVKLADLGECRRDGQAPEHGGVVRPATANWSPPEVLAGEAREYRPSMDVYSLGLVLNEIMTLQVPFFHSPYTAMDRSEFVEHVCTMGGRPPIGHNTPSALKELFLRCWQRDPGARPTSAEVLRQLRALVEDVSHVELS